MSLFMVTIKLTKNPEHNPQKKVTGECAVSTYCTDVTGEHHTLLVNGQAGIDAARAKYGHVTRVEKVEPTA